MMFNLIFSEIIDSQLQSQDYDYADGDPILPTGASKCFFYVFDNQIVGQMRNYKMYREKQIS